MSKYEKAKKAARSRDAESLAWELVLTSLQDIEDGNVPDLGKSVLMELIKTVSAGHRNDKYSNTTEASDDGLTAWAGGTPGTQQKRNPSVTPTSQAAALRLLKEMK